MDLNSIAKRTTWPCIVPPDFQTSSQGNTFTPKPEKMSRKRRSFSKESKAKAALEALRKRETLQELAKKYEP